MMRDYPRQTISVIGTPIDELEWSTALSRVVAWGKTRQSRYVCLCNVHSVVAASRDRDVAAALAGADMATADGAPIAWMMRHLGFPGQDRIDGPGLMLRACAGAAEAGTSVYLFGSAPHTLHKLEEKLAEQFPSLRIAGSASPPFSEPTADHFAQQAREINASGAGIVFVSLGCPKQELWMARQRGTVQAAMIGVGAAFDFHSGLRRRAPAWMRDSGLEWLHRLLQEPGRLWRRYLVSNSIFLVQAGAQLLRRDGKPSR